MKTDKIDFLIGIITISLMCVAYMLSWEDIKLDFSWYKGY